jgi:hypothetical protein
MSCPYASAAIGSLDRPPSTLRPSGAATKIGSQNWTPPLPEWGQTDQDRSPWPMRERLLLQVVAGRLHLWPIGSPAARHAPPDAIAARTRSCRSAESLRLTSQGTRPASTSVTRRSQVTNPDAGRHHLPQRQVRRTAAWHGQQFAVGAGYQFKCVTDRQVRHVGRR